VPVRCGTRTRNGARHWPHTIGNKAEAAYRRGDALEKRFAMMDAWARHCEGGEGENVLKFKRPG